MARVKRVTRNGKIISVTFFKDEVAGVESMAKQTKSVRDSTSVKADESEQAADQNFQVKEEL